MLTVSPSLEGSRRYADPLPGHDASEIADFVNNKFDARTEHGRNLRAAPRWNREQKLRREIRRAQILRSRNPERFERRAARWAKRSNNSAARMMLNILATNITSMNTFRVPSCSAWLSLLGLACGCTVPHVEDSRAHLELLPRNQAHESSVEEMTCSILDCGQGVLCYADVIRGYRRRLPLTKRELRGATMQTVANYACLVSDRSGVACINVWHGRVVRSGTEKPLPGRKTVFWELGWCAEVERRDEMSRYECMSPGSIDASFGFWSGSRAEFASFDGGACICSVEEKGLSDSNQNLLAMGAMCVLGWGDDPMLGSRGSTPFREDRLRVVAFSMDVFPLLDYSHVCDAVDGATADGARGRIDRLLETESGSDRRDQRATRSSPEESWELDSH